MGSQWGTNLRPAFAAPVIDAQRAFRMVLDAMARPGRVVGIDLVPAGPPPLDPATAAVMLTLVDGDTPLWLDGAAATGAAMDYARFHCGCRLASRPQEASFAVIANVAQMPPLAAFPAGSDEYPDRSATLILQLPSLFGGRPLTLAGPGIRHGAQLAVAGLPAAFPHWLEENHAMFPRGVDLIFTSGRQLAALPRSTRLAGS
jgi:alpha-D-ribose 1-methylphosphonate 5-triphosphate synthase subunit PhnH